MNPPRRESQPVTLPDLNPLYEKIGDMQATLRVVKHETTNTSAKVDALATLVANQGHVIQDVQQLKDEVRQLQIEKFKRDGAIGLVEWLSRHWPVLVLIGALVAYAIAAGRV
jgi:hypothetical protein